MRTKRTTLFFIALAISISTMQAQTRLTESFVKVRSYYLKHAVADLDLQFEYDSTNVMLVSERFKFPLIGVEATYERDNKSNRDYVWITCPPIENCILHREDGMFIGGFKIWFSSMEKCVTFITLFELFRKQVQEEGQ